MYYCKTCDESVPDDLAGIHSAADHELVDITPFPGHNIEQGLMPTGIAPLPPYPGLPQDYYDEMIAEFHKLLRESFSIPEHLLNPCYILDSNRQPVPISDKIEWAKWHAWFPKRNVLQTWIRGVRISTVFLGFAHGFDEPMHFETSIMEDEPEIFDQYPTWDAAEAGHREAVKEVLKRWPWYKRFFAWLFASEVYAEEIAYTNPKLLNKLGILLNINELFGTLDHKLSGMPPGGAP